MSHSHAMRMASCRDRVEVVDWLTVLCQNLDRQNLDSQNLDCIVGPII
jgi:hypothetical protein